VLERGRLPAVGSLLTPLTKKRRYRCRECGWTAWKHRLRRPDRHRAPSLGFDGAAGLSRMSLLDLERRLHALAGVPAWECVAEWGPEHAGILGTLLSAAGITSRMVPDAHLAALAIEHGLIVSSPDADFARFFPASAGTIPLAASDRRSTGLWNLDLCVTARRGGVHGGDDARDMNPNERPACLPKDHDRDSATGKILLAANLLVRCHQQLEARRLCSVEQLPILERRPLLFISRPNRVTWKELAEGTGVP
jgi:hypothetical protein